MFIFSSHLNLNGIVAIDDKDVYVHLEIEKLEEEELLHETLEKTVEIVNLFLRRLINEEVFNLFDGLIEITEKTKIRLVRQILIIR